jgi:hypothetical protein
MQRAMFRRTEDKIRKLSELLLEATDDQEMARTLTELRVALRQHIDRLRARMASYPIMVKRRTYPSSEDTSGSGRAPGSLSR